MSVLKIQSDARQSIKHSNKGQHNEKCPKKIKNLDNCLIQKFNVGESKRIDECQTEERKMQKLIIMGRIK